MPPPEAGVNGYVATAPGVGALGFDWGSVLSTGLRIGERAATHFFPSPGTYEQRGPGGSVIIRGEGGPGPLTLGPTTVPAWAWLAGGGLVLVLLLAGARR